MTTNTSDNSTSSYPYYYPTGEFNSSSSSFDYCSIGHSIFIAYMVTRMLLLVPLSILVLYLGYRRWRQQRSFATTSHSDIFTFHMAAMDLISAFGCTAYFCGRYTGLLKVTLVGVYLFYLALVGQICFHILTCVERYLAVVHPIIYLGLRHSGGDKIRNIIIVFVWLLSFGGIGVLFLPVPYLPIILIFCILVFSLIVVSFCSLSVLCVLIRPGPGEVSGERVNQVKRRAFHIITAITGVLWFCFAGFLVCFGLIYSKHTYSRSLSYSDRCLVAASGYWFGLPSNLVLPLLFLHGAGKLPCCHQRNV